MRIVVAVIVYNRIDNIALWLERWSRSDTKDAEIVIISNGVHLSGAINRKNIGYDIGAFQDVCRKRLKGFPDYDYLIWCTDDVIPMRKDFIRQFISKMNNRTGVVCMQISNEFRNHVRTTGFCVKKEIAERLVFPADPIITKEHCYEFEHRGTNTLTDQIQRMGLDCVQVAPIRTSPLYDTNYWKRNSKAIKQKSFYFRDINEFYDQHSYSGV